MCEKFFANWKDFMRLWIWKRRMVRLIIMVCGKYKVLMEFEKIVESSAEYACLIVGRVCR